MLRTRRYLAHAVVGCTVAALGVAAVPRSVVAAVPPETPSFHPTVAYSQLHLPDGRYAVVYTDGLARVVDPDRGTAEVRNVPLRRDAANPAGVLPARPDLVATLAQGRPEAYASDSVLVVYDGDVSGPSRLDLGRSRADAARPATYTSDGRLNKVLAGLGVARAERVLPDLAPTAAKTAPGTTKAGTDTADRPLLDVSRLYRLRVPAETVPAAVAALRADPAVSYAAPDWRVTTLNTGPTPVPDALLTATAPTARTAGTTTPAGGLPTNFGLTTSAQSLLNQPGVNAVAAYAAISQRFGQLPGQGEIITNVSLGTLTDQSTAADPAHPCFSWAASYGPTTVVQDGQRYLDWPGMPLIPTYTADSDATLDPLGQTCGADDPVLSEAGLDFTMMAPLPRDRQRPERPGSGYTDLLGIAPGADYRLVLPARNGPTTADMAAAFLASARQEPRPTVITASIGFGFDTAGFSGRYMEDDPIMASVIATIVRDYRIVVCVSSGDGTRGYTNAAVSASGGSTATEVADRRTGPVTDLADVGHSTAPSVIPDTGSIAVGGSTLNDTTSAPPPGEKVGGQPAYAETRYNGSRGYASGRGSRVNLSAPGDNLLALAHAVGGSATDVTVAYNGGTSASTPEVAAVAALVLQVAKLTGNKKLLTGAKRLTDPVRVRDFLVATATPTYTPAQSDVELHVGAQVNAGRAVERLLAEAGKPLTPSVPRVGVVARHPRDPFDTIFDTTTDPANIPLDHDHLNDRLTIAPDWLGLPEHGVRYALTVGGRRLADTPAARLLPGEVLAAAGLPLAAPAPRTVELTYTATKGKKTLAQARVSLTFGPGDGRSTYGPAPEVPAVVRGDSIPVTYDLRSMAAVPSDAVLVVSEPGRVDPVSAQVFRPAYTVPLTRPAGTVRVPVSALSGGGIYGVGIQPASAGRNAVTYTPFSYLRVAPTSDAQPAEPTLAAVADHGAGGHNLVTEYGEKFRVSWDVRDVPGADGAIIEISAPGPTIFGNRNLFNNPNGTVRDANGVDTGSVHAAPVRGTRGSVTLDPATVGLSAAMDHVVRVLPTRRGRVVGQASGVSSLSRDGVRPIGGGSLAGGYGINSAGDEGFLTVNQGTGAVQLFDQKTNTVTGTVASSTSRYQTAGLIGAGPGVLANGVGLYQRIDPDGTKSFQVLKPVATGGDGGAWTPPAENVPATGTSGPLPAPNQRTSTTAFLYGQNGPNGGYRVFTSDVAANTFGTPTDVQPALAGIPYPLVTAFGADNTTRQAVLAGTDLFSSGGETRFVSVDLDSGTVQTFPGLGRGGASGLAIDSTTHRMLAPTRDGGLGIYDLGTRTGVPVTLTGTSYQHPTVDETNGYFVMEEVRSPGSFGEVIDNNGVCSVVVLDQTGKLVKRISGFNFFDIALPINGSYVQLNPATRTGYTLGPAGAQLAVFRY
ncbi:S8 family serine peptidase [Plantactinospora sp. B5E13]|uniref:S8 family serine peptidase n=1 Tax=Plantactinospora sp. B5E13 TaxID=3153758 RepID=UPI00325CD1E1